MAAQPQGADSLLANGTADAHLANGGLDDSASAPENGSAKLSAAEKKRLKKKQRKANKQAQRAKEVEVGGAAAGKTNDKDAPEVEVEYVSAPHEYEELLQSEPEAAPEAIADLGSAEGGLGFVAAVTSGAGSGLGFTPGLGSSAGLGARPGLGADATPALGSDYGSETPYLGGSGLGLGATPSVESGMQQDEPKDEPKSNPYEEFARVFSMFASAEEVTNRAAIEEEDALPQDEEAEEAAEVKNEEKEEKGDFDDEETGEQKLSTRKREEQILLKDEDKEEKDDSDDEETAEQKLSKRKRKEQNRLKIAELKQTCPRPEVVEVWDVTAQDPKLLVYLKAYRNTVPVPRHWSQKRKYLQGKRGLEKPPFKLPDFIEATGIGEMRQAYQEKEENKKLKQKQKDKMQPKMGKLDIDYQVLHDAFFKYQGKPNFSIMGDLYYEGKEFEARIRSAKPGILSEELRKSLGMGDNTPPPWLINMQRYGPPPSYPDLRVAGLNAPIPPGAQFGYQPGGWGKPPVDEEGNPLYGDVFGLTMEQEEDELVDKMTKWGDLESEEEESEEEEEEEEVEDDTESLADGIASIASGYNSSLPSGIETPEVIDLRKGKAGEQRPLYQVLEQQQAQVGGNLMGSDHTYVIPGGKAAPGKKGGVPDVEVAIDPAELEGLDEEGVRALYDERLAQQQSTASRENFADMVAAKAVQQKRKAAERKEGKAKKTKESFKF